MGWVTAGVAITAAADQTPSCLATFLNRTCLPVDHALDEAQLVGALVASVAEGFCQLLFRAHLHNGIM